MKILYFAAVREILKRDEEVIEISRPLTVGEVFYEHISPRLEGVGIERLLFAVNEELVNPDFRVSNGDVLAVLPPLSGGTS